MFFRDSWSEGKWQLAIIDGELNCICWMRRKSGTTEAPGMCRPRTLRSWKECLCSSDLKQMVSIQSYLPKFSIYFFWITQFSLFSMNNNPFLPDLILFTSCKIYTLVINGKSWLCIAICSKWGFNLVNFEVY